MLKRKRLFIAILCFVFLLAACGNSSPEIPDSKKLVSDEEPSGSGNSASVEEPSGSGNSASIEEPSGSGRSASVEELSAPGESASDEGSLDSGGNLPVSKEQDSDISTYSCENCGGTGKVEITLGCYGCNNGVSFYTGKTCTQCDGNGNVIQELNCRECGGDGIIGNETSGYPAAPLPGSNTGLDIDFSGSSGSAISCPVCSGLGKKICPSCDGSGSLSQTKNSSNFGFGSSSYQVNQKCHACNGSGHVPCTSCGGDGQL